MGIHIKEEKKERACTDKAISLVADYKLKGSRLEEENGLLKAELETRKEEVSQ